MLVCPRKCKQEQKSILPHPLRKQNTPYPTLPSLNQRTPRTRPTCRSQLQANMPRTPVRHHLVFPWLAPRVQGISRELALHNPPRCGEVPRVEDVPFLLSSRGEQLSWDTQRIHLADSIVTVLKEVQPLALVLNFFDPTVERVTFRNESPGPRGWRLELVREGAMIFIVFVENSPPPGQRKIHHFHFQTNRYLRAWSFPRDEQGRDLDAVGRNTSMRVAHKLIWNKTWFNHGRSRINLGECRAFWNFQEITLRGQVLLTDYNCRH